MAFLGSWGLISKMWEDRFQVDLTTNSNLFLECIIRPIGMFDKGLA